MAAVGHAREDTAQVGRSKRERLHRRTRQRHRAMQVQSAERLFLYIDPDDRVVRVGEPEHRRRLRTQEFATRHVDAHAPDDIRRGRRGVSHRPRDHRLRRGGGRRRTGGIVDRPQFDHHHPAEWVYRGKGGTGSLVIDDYDNTIAPVGSTFGQTNGTDET
jgi:hypothetical protein